MLDEDLPPIDFSANVYRGILIGIILFSLIFLIIGNSGALGLTTGDEKSLATARGEGSLSTGEQIVQPRKNMTVITSELSGYILAVNQNGSVAYYNESHYFYYDVDPSPIGRSTVVYSALDVLDVNNSVCESTERRSGRFLTGCTRQVIERVNLTTGETVQLYSRIYPRRSGAEWHDVDRINRSHFIIADMHDDEVYVINTETGITTWRWEAQNYLPITIGGPYPDDWTHLNDVEVLQDGRVMVSLRNQDQVVFINKSTGVVDDWTIGSDDKHNILYEQHNPDYIPAENGGPAVVVADSENNRIVEYQRTQSGGWRKSWQWGSRNSSLLEWPRDADRLPNGHTLITDTHNNRIIEINTQGEIVWSINVSKPYEAERIGTGDESYGGNSAVRINLESRSDGGGTTQDTDRGFVFSIKSTIKSVVPNKIKHGIQYTLSLLGLFWVGFFDLALILVILISAGTWVLLELRWSQFGVRSPIVRSK